MKMYEVLYALEFIGIFLLVIWFIGRGGNNE